MPCLSWAIKHDLAPIVPVGISLPDYLSGVTPQITHTSALIDTGASVSCICTALAEKLGLPVIGKGLMNSTTHRVASQIFQANLYFFVPGLHCHREVGIELMEFTNAPHGFQLLLGRPFLKGRMFSISNIATANGGLCQEFVLCL